MSKFLKVHFGQVLVVFLEHIYLFKIAMETLEKGV